MYDYIERRIAVLRAVHEWVRNRPAGEHRIEAGEVATLVGGGEYVDPFNTDPAKQAAKNYQQDQIALFVGLVNDGLIDARPYWVESGTIFVFAMVRGLTRQGLELIQQ